MLYRKGRKGYAKDAKATFMARSAVSKKSAFPATAGIRSRTAPSPDRWIPAFAGNADCQLATRSPNSILTQYRQGCCALRARNLPLRPLRILRALCVKAFSPSLRMHAPPVLGDVAAGADPHAIAPGDVIEKFDEPGDAARAADKPVVQGQRHQLRLV